MVEPEQITMPIGQGTATPALEKARMKVRDLVFAVKGFGVSHEDVETIAGLGPGWTAVWLRVRSKADWRQGFKLEELLKAAEEQQKQEKAELERVKRRQEREAASQAKKAAKQTASPNA